MRNILLSVPSDQSTPPLANQYHTSSLRVAYKWHNTGFLFIQQQKITLTGCPDTVATPRAGITSGTTGASRNQEKAWHCGTFASESVNILSLCYTNWLKEERGEREKAREREDEGGRDRENDWKRGGCQLQTLVIVPIEMFNLNSVFLYPTRQCSMIE